MAQNVWIHDLYLFNLNFQSIPSTPVSGLKRNLMDEMNSVNDQNRNNSLRNSPRAMATSLEGGLDDVDLLAIGQGSPIGDLIQRVLGKWWFLSSPLFPLDRLFSWIFLENFEPHFPRTDTHPPFSHNPYTATPKKRPLDEHKEQPDCYVFAKPVSVAPTPRKTKRQSPGKES